MGRYNNLPALMYEKEAGPSERAGGRGRGAALGGAQRAAPEAADAGAGAGGRGSNGSPPVPGAAGRERESGLDARGGLC